MKALAVSFFILGMVLALPGTILVAVAFPPAQPSAFPLVAVIASAGAVSLLLGAILMLLAVRSAPPPRLPADATILYADGLVTITDHDIWFRGYTLFGDPRRVAFSDIASITPLVPTIWNGKWRIQGTGDFRTWFPYDGKRPRRDTIFLLKFRDRARRIGFTVEDSARVKQILQDKSVLAPAERWVGRG